MPFHHCHTFRLSTLLSAAGTALALGLCFTAATAAEETYGPVNLVKTMPTPFSAPSAAADSAAPSASGRLVPGTGLKLSLGQATSPAGAGSASTSSATHSLLSRLPHRSLSDRLVSSRLYLPGRMILGKPAEFTIKGKPGSSVALAMADKDAGAKPIYEHRIRLGADRKVVSVGKIPDSGVIELVIETPIQGDLVGQYLFFEAALWTQPDFSDLEIAAPVTSEGQVGIQNGVLIAAEAEQKRGLRFVPDSAVPLLQRDLPSGHTLDSGRP